MMRMTTLYSGSTLVDGCQFIDNTYFEDKEPGECNAFEEGFFFITEAPDQHVLFRNSRFVNNTGTGESFGGALTLRVDASIIGCHFEGNRARQGGAIYVDETSSLSVADSTFIGNVAEVGGAISAYVHRSRLSRGRRAGDRADQCTIKFSRRSGTAASSPSIRLTA